MKKEKNDPQDILEAFNTLTGFLTSQNLEFSRLENLFAYKIKFQHGKFGTQTCYAEIDTTREHFVFYVSIPIKVSEESRNSVGEYILRTNYGLRVGDFEMDYTDGEIRYKSIINFRGETLTAGLIQNAIEPALYSTEKYLPGIALIIRKGLSAKDALQTIEGK